jgi:hypothetical protein
LKETSYPTDISIIARFAGIATIIGNYLLDAIVRRLRQMISRPPFTMIRPVRMMQLPAEKLKFRRPVNLRKK